MKIRIKIPSKLSLENLVMFIALFCISSFALLEHVSISIPVFSTVKFPLLYVGGICILIKIDVFFNNFKKRKYFFVLLTAFLLCVVLGLSALMNGNPVIGVNPMRTTIRLILFLAELFVLAIWIAEKGKFQQVINFLFWYTLIVVVVTDFLFFTRVLVFFSGRHENYLIGTKFSVAYMHMNLLTLWLMRNNRQLIQGKRKKWFVFLATIFLVVVSIRVDCMTGVLGCALLCVFYMTYTPLQKRSVRLKLPVLLCLCLLGSVIFPFLAERIVSIPFVTYLVESVLGRDSTLTGRILIFRLFGSKMEGHWLWGFGYGNGNVAAEALFQCANAQNAQLQWILQAGLPATILIAFLALLVFIQLSKSPNKRRAMPLVNLLFVYIILGTVETTFNMSFFLWIALIFVLVNEKKMDKARIDNNKT